MSSCLPTSLAPYGFPEVFVVSFTRFGPAQLHLSLACVPALLLKCSEGKRAWLSTVHELASGTARFAQGFLGSLGLGVQESSSVLGELFMHLFVLFSW